MPSMIGSDPGDFAGADEPSVKELVTTATQQLSDLVRAELRSAQVELTQKAKQAGTGAGLFVLAGIGGLLALQAAVVAAIAGLHLVLPVWAAALVVTGGLAVVAGVAALVAKRQVGRASPLVPQQTIESVKEDAEEITAKLHGR